MNLDYALVHIYIFTSNLPASNSPGLSLFITDSKNFKKQICQNWCNSSNLRALKIAMLFLSSKNFNLVVYTEIFCKTRWKTITPLELLLLNRTLWELFRQNDNNLRFTHDSVAFCLIMSLFYTLLQQKFIWYGDKM